LSQILLNGGLGVSSQLKTLNEFIIGDARRNVANESTEYDESPTNPSTVQSIPVMTCDEAIVFLARVQETARTGENEVAGLTIGFGQGLSRRVRATQTLDQKLKESRQKWQDACSGKKYAISERAKARWQWVLEQVTTGGLKSSLVNQVSPEFRALWRWRSMFAFLFKQQSDRKRIPAFLLRGWRLSKHLSKNWSSIHPEYWWSHPNSKRLESIPIEVESKEVVASIAGALVELGFYTSRNAASLRFRLIRERVAETTWDAGLVFEAPNDAKAIQAAAGKGIVVSTSAVLAQVTNQIAKSQSRWEEAKAAYLVRLFIRSIFSSTPHLNSRTPHVVVRKSRSIPLKRIDSNNDKLRMPWQRLCLAFALSGNPRRMKMTKVWYSLDPREASIATFHRSAAMFSTRLCGCLLSNATMF
jgi:hypothetical protein